jgi:hypothetical protein
VQRPIIEMRMRYPYLSPAQPQAIKNTTSTAPPGVP